MSILSDKLAELKAAQADTDASLQAEITEMDALFALIQDAVNTGDIATVQAAIDAAKAEKAALDAASSRNAPPAPAKPV